MINKLKLNQIELDQQLSSGTKVFTGLIQLINPQIVVDKIDCLNIDKSKQLTN